MFGIGVSRAGADRAAADDAAAAVPAERPIRTPAQSTIEMVPGTTLEQTEAVADQVAALLESQPEVERVLERGREGSATTVRHAQGRPRRAPATISSGALTPAAAADPRRAGDASSSQRGGGGTGRDMSVMLAGSDPELLEQTAQTLVEQMKGVDGVVAPRIAADLQRPELIIVPRLDLAAQLGVTTAALSQAIRIATMGEIDQNAAKFSLSRPPDPDPGQAARRVARSDLVDDREPARSDRSRRLGAAGARRRDQLRRGPDADPALQPVAPRVRRRRSRRQASSRARRWTQIDALPVMQNLPPGVSSAPVGEDQWQAGADHQLHHRGGRRHPAGVRGAGAALPPVHLAAGQHGLAAARAAGRAARARDHRAAACRCRSTSAC